MLNNEKKIINYFEKRFKKKISLNSKIMIDLDIDSFEFVKIIYDIEKKIKKKYNPLMVEDFSNMTIKKFLRLFR